MIFKAIRLKSWEQRALHALGSGRYEQAEHYFKRIYEAVPGGEGVRYNMGLASFAQGKYDVAESYFEAELERFGESAHSLKALAELSYQTGRRKHARRYLRRLAAHCDGTERELVQRRIAVVEDEGKFTAACEAQQAVWNAEDALRRGDWQTALDEYRRAAELDETQFTARAGIGKIALEYLGDLGEALKAYREAYALAPDPRYQQQIERIERTLARRGESTDARLDERS